MRKTLSLVAVLLAAVALMAFAQAEATLTVSKTSVTTYEETAYAVSIPGAESIQLYDNQWPSDFSGSDEIYFDIPGEHFLCAVGTMPDGSKVRTNGVIVNVSAPNGLLAIPEFTRTDNSDGTVTFTFQPAAVADYIGLEISNVATGENLTAENIQLDGPEGGSYTTPVLTAGSLYRVWLYVGADSKPGYAHNYTTVDFFAPGSEAALDDSVTLTVNGSTEDRSGRYGEFLNVDITAPGATAFCFWDGESLQYDYADEDGHLYVSSGAAGYITAMTARATTQDRETIGDDWESVQWGAWCEPVYVSNGFYAGYTPTPTIEAPASVARGDILEVRLGNIDMSYEYSYGFQVWMEYYEEGSGGGGRVGDFATSGFDTLRMSTADVPPGDYLLVVYGSRMDWGDVIAYREITVTEPAQSQALKLSLDQTEAPTGCDVLASVYAPGMVSAAVGWSWQFDSEDEQPEIMEGDAANAWLWTSDEPGEYEVLARAWDAQGNLYEARATVTVVIYGDLAAPVITAPAELRPGEDFTFSFDEVENAENYRIYIWPVAEEGDAWHPDDVTAAGAYTAPAEFFHEGMIYRLTVEAFTPGYRLGSAQAGFAVRSATAPSHEYSFYVEESPVPVNGQANFIIDAPGATAMRWRDSSGWGGGETEGGWSDWWGADYWLLDREYDEPGTYAMQIMLSYDENFDWENDDWNAHSWTEPSAPVSVTVTSEGRLAEPELSVPDTVRRGEPLNVTFTEAPHASQYELRINDVETWEEMYYTVVYAPGTVPLLTGNLVPGRAYNVELMCKTVGYVSSWVNGRFTAEEATQQVSLSLADGPYYIGTNIKFSIVAPGATKLELLTRNADQDSFELRRTYDGDAIQDEEAIWAVGAAKVRARATFSGGVKTADVDIQVGSLGRAGCVTANFQPSIFVGETLVLTGFDNHEHSEAGGVYVERDGQNYFTNEEVYWDWDSFDVDTANLPAGEYVLSFNVWPFNGYEFNSNVYGFRVVDEGSANTLWLPADLTMIEAGAFEGNSSVEIVHVSGGVTAIGAGAFRDMENLSFVELGSGVTSIGSGAFDGDPFVVLICPDGSYAANWADQHGIAHRP